MKYAVYTMTAGDWFEELFDTERDAIIHADNQFEIQGYARDRRVTAYFVARGEVDEDGAFDLDSADIIKEYK